VGIHDEFQMNSRESEEKAAIGWLIAQNFSVPVFRFPNGKERAKMDHT
jgi:hypothetical protein